MTYKATQYCFNIDLTLIDFTPTCTFHFIPVSPSISIPNFIACYTNTLI